MVQNYFEAETSASLKHIQNQRPIMYFKIPDTKMLRFAVNNQNLITQKVPSDFYALVNGRSYFLECKSFRKPSYSLKYIEQHQIDSLRLAEICGGISWFLINCRKERSNIRAWAVKPAIISEWNETGYKSVKWEMIAQRGIELERMEGAKWNLKPLLNLL